MGVITFDMITRNLDDTIQNLDYLEKQGFTDFLATVLYDVYEAIRELACEIIESGEGVEPNVGGYARDKAMGKTLYSRDRGIFIVGYTPTSHGLGILTGDLYNGVMNQPIGNVAITRGREVCIGTTFDTPTYISDVHSGKPGVMPRPFLDLATRRVEMVLTEAVEKYLTDLQISSPPPQFISSLIVRHALNDLTVY